MQVGAQQNFRSGRRKFPLGNKKRKRACWTSGRSCPAGEPGAASGAVLGQMIEEGGAAAGVIVDPADHLALLGEVGEVPADGDGGEPGLGSQGLTGAALLRGLGQMGPDPLQSAGLESLRDVLRTGGAGEQGVQLLLADAGCGCRWRSAGGRTYPAPAESGGR